MQTAGTNSDRAIARMIATGSGILPFLLGLVVLVGWYTHNKTLIQVSPAFVPMQYNTALGFLACGLGLFFGIRAKNLGALVLGGLATLIGGLTLVEYVFVVDLGIDQLLMEHYVTVATSNPGRMAPNTALCFSLTGIGLLLSKSTLTRRSMTFSLGILGSLIFGLGLIAASGYAIGLETAYGWGNLTRMAVHTSAGFVVLGVGLVAFAWSEEPAGEHRYPPWLAVVVGITILTVTVSLWQALNAVQAIGIAQYFVLIFGFVLSLALGVSIRLGGVSRQKADAAEAARKQIELEIEERKQAEQKLEEEAKKREAARLRLEAEIEERREAEKRLEEAHRSLEGRVEERTRELREEMADVEDAREALNTEMQEIERAKNQAERFNRLAVGRELKMIELKKEIDELLDRLGEVPRYKRAG